MTISNNTVATELGAKAAQAWDKSASSGDAGDALAINALYLASRTMTFTAEVERKKEDIIEKLDFDFNDWMTPLFNADGSKDTRAMAARTSAVVLRVFGMTEVNGATRVRIERTKKIADYLAKRHAFMEDDAYATAVTMKGNKLVVPHAAVHTEPKPDASDNEIAIYDAMKDKPCTLDGKNNASLAQLGRRATPPKETRHATVATDKGNSLNASVDYLTAIVRQLNSVDAECEVALDNAMREKLYFLVNGLATYFEADPIEGELEARKAA